MDERGRRRLAIGAGDPDHLVRRKLGPGAGEQLDVADDFDAGVAGALRDRVAVERKAGRDDEAVELGEVGVVEIGDVKSPRERGRGTIRRMVEGGWHAPSARRPSPSSRRSVRASSFASHAVTFAPLASSASTVARPERASP